MIEHTFESRVEVTAASACAESLSPYYEASYKRTLWASSWLIVFGAIQAVRRKEDGNKTAFSRVILTRKAQCHSAAQSCGIICAVNRVLNASNYKIYASILCDAV